MDSLERLQGLHADLQAFTETRLANIDRLWHELEESVQEFRKLLDKPAPSASERETYNGGKITLLEQEFSINDEFKHLSRAVGTALELDEVEAGKLLIGGSPANTPDDDSFIAEAVSRFHDRRDLLLQSLRITLEEALNLDREDGARDFFREIVAQTLNTKTGPPSNGSAFASKCLKALEDVEIWLGKVNEQIQSRQLLSQMRGHVFYATLEFQRGSLFKQHEALGAILALLFRGNYTVSDDLQKLYAVVKRWQRLDISWIHYLPAFSAAFRQYGSPEGSTSADDAKRLNRTITANMTSNTASPARPLHAVIELWWIVEYSGWFREPTTQDQESDKRSKMVKTALDDHALNFLLLICSNIHLEMWRHSARQELVALLIGDQSGIAIDVDHQTSSYFYMVLMESIETFAEAWITNMPDSIRQLKNEEDDKRMLQIIAAQKGVVNAAQRDQVGRLNLESFLVLIAFAFEGRPDGAEQFWEDPDSNLFGFLTWASKRQTVPRVSAFCEMLCAISEGPENAQAAHKFLLDEYGTTITSRSRRVPTMNYQQMFAELELYALKVHDKTPITPVPGVQGTPLPDFNEAESPVMLSCYLRLLSHMFRQNVVTRQHVLGHAGFDFPQALLMLASGPIPSYLRATIFRTLEALLSDKDSSTSNSIWQAIDEWASSSHDIKAVAKSGQPPERSLTLLQATLSSVAMSFDQYDAFVDLLRRLLAPSPKTVIDGQPLPFSPELGSSYRRPGIAPYVDFVCGQIFVKRTRELGDDTQALMCSYHCLDFIAVGLEGFDENFVTMLSKNSKESNGADAPPPDHVYARCHPFGRIMQWLFSSSVNKALLEGLHKKIDDVQAALSDDPIILNLVRALDIINLVLDLQPTYFDLIQPIVKDIDSSKGMNSAGYTSFEDSIVSHSEVILSLCQYAATSHLHLSVRSLALLQKLTGSPKLNNESAGSNKSQLHRLIDMLGPNASTVLLPVAETMATMFQIDERELEDGFEASGYLMKDGILAFLNSCLGVQTEAPSIAHMLLGFGRIGNRLVITPSVDNGESLFNAISRLIMEYPDGQNGDLVSWLIHLKSAGMRALQHLWSAPVSADLTLGQLRRSNFLAAGFASQFTVSQGTIWDGYCIADPEFWHTTSAEALTELLSLRASFYDYAAREINSIGSEKLTSLQRQLVATLQGKTIGADGVQQSHLTIFDMFDFADLDTSAAPQVPDLQYFVDVDFESFRAVVVDSSLELYDIGMVQSLLQMIQGLLQEQQVQKPQQKAVDQDAMTLEANSIIGRLEARNRWTLAQKAKSEALHNYVDMVVSAVESASLDLGSKTQFILHILQITLPKLDMLVVEEASEAIELARLADALLLALSSNPSTNKSGRMDDIIAERLFQLFRICIEGIPLSSTSLELRTTLYSICSQYLMGIMRSEPAGNDPYKKARTNSMDCVRSASQHLIGLISDDAEDGTDTCRLNALQLLSMLTSLARSLKSNLIIDAFAKANVLEILLEPLRNIASDFASTSTKHRPFLLTIFEARMLLLLQISRTHPGASALLDSGLLQALRDSIIFRADPDLGMDLDTSSQSLSTSSAPSTSALLNYFILLSSSLRVLLSTFLSRGPDNEQIQFLVRSFLADHRANMVGLFKRAAGVSGKVEDARTRIVLDECVRCYTGLAIGCGFVDFEDESALEGLKSGNGFS